MWPLVIGAGALWSSQLMVRAEPYIINQIEVGVLPTRTRSARQVMRTRR
jgi:hypothetical protein